MVVCLQETKLTYISDFDVSSIMGQGFSSYVYLPAQETRGGILVAWRGDLTSAESHRVHRHSVTVKFQILRGKKLGGFRMFMGHTKMLRSQPS